MIYIVITIDSESESESRLHSFTPFFIRFFSFFSFLFFSVLPMYLNNRKRQKIWSNTGSTISAPVHQPYNVKEVPSVVLDSPAPTLSSVPTSSYSLPHAPFKSRSRPYPCRVCNIMMSSASNRARHERIKHPGTARATKCIKFDSGNVSSMRPVASLGRITPSDGSPTPDVVIMESESEDDVDTGKETTEENRDSCPLADDFTSRVMAAAAAASNSPSNSTEGVPNEVNSHSSEEAEEENMRGMSEVAVDGESPAAAAAPSVPLWTPPGHPILSDSELQTGCFSFLQWLTQPPMTATEAIVKARRISHIKQLQPIKLHLRFIFGLLVERSVLTKVDLASLAKLSICQSLLEAMNRRNVGSGRIHAIFLVVKKVLVFLSSEESQRTRQYVLPTTAESFLYVDNVCAESSQRRKQEARNRAVLGIRTIETLRSGVIARPPMEQFSIPSTWSPTAEEKERADAEVNTSESSQSSQSSSVTGPSCNELSPEELKQITQGCLQYLQQALRSVNNESSSCNSNNTIYEIADQLFVQYLVTATLCLGLAPRSQVLKELRVGTSFKKEADGRYWIRILAELNKNHKPSCFALPMQLTSAYDTYLSTIRPRMLQQLGVNHDYVFFKRCGKSPRHDFSEITSVVTQHLIGRPVNAHAFRGAVITLFYDQGEATQADMDKLATIMAHDSSTAKNYYYRPQIQQAALGTSERILSLLDLSLCGSSE
jgi:hypothetical protein